MRIVDLHEAQANLEQLIDELKPGESFAIAVGGVPRVRVIALTPEEIKGMRMKKRDIAQTKTKGTG